MEIQENTETMGSGKNVIKYGVRQRKPSLIEN
jgi:hypothetical protein